MLALQVRGFSYNHKIKCDRQLQIKQNRELLLLKDFQQFLSKDPLIMQQDNIGKILTLIDWVKFYIQDNLSMIMNNYKLQPRPINSLLRQQQIKTFTLFQIIIHLNDDYYVGLLKILLENYQKYLKFPLTNYCVFPQTPVVTNSIMNIFHNINHQGNLLQINCLWAMLEVFLNQIRNQKFYPSKDKKIRALSPNIYISTKKNQFTQLPSGVQGQKQLLHRQLHTSQQKSRLFRSISSNKNNNSIQK